MDLGVIITAVVGAFTTFTSGFVSWFFTRKKYNTEVDSAVIENMKESLEFYKKLSDDNKTRLDTLLERNTILEKELSELRNQVIGMMSSICMDLTCQLRKRDSSYLNKLARAETAEEKEGEV